MIDWVFLDVGNVLFIDDPQNFQGYRFVHELISKHHADYTFAEMLAEREKWAADRGRFHSQKNRPPAAAGIGSKGRVRAAAILFGRVLRRVQSVP